jgi:hypothetical protein
MDEVFPILAGIALGLVVWRANSRRFRAWLLSLCSLVLGAVASWISGELLVSAWYLVVDCVQVLVAAWITTILASAHDSRKARVAPRL